MRRWVTCGSPTLEAIINPLAAACSHGFVPDEFVILVNQNVEQTVDDAIELAQLIVSEYDESLAVEKQLLNDERDFETIVAYFREYINAGDEIEVAVDFTPGRKFMSAIAFQAGVQYDADHVFYLFLDSPRYYGQIYDDIPEPATELIDFMEVVP